MKPTIACVGALTLDWIDTKTERKGPFPAGNAIYSAVGAWLAGSAPVIVARIGADYPGAALDAVSSKGLSISHVKSVPGNSYRVLLTEHDGGRDVRYLTDSGQRVTLDPTPAELPHEALAGIHVAPCAVPAQRALLEAAKKRGWRSSLDLLFFSEQEEPIPEDVYDLLPRCSAFLPSLAEIRRLWPDVSGEESLSRLLDAGCRTAVVKMGAAGCVGADEGRRFRLPAITTRVVDPTGAGDAFCGAFLVEWLEKGDLASAMAWGSAAASVVIEDYGVLHAVEPTAREVTRERALRALSRISAL